MIDTHICVNPSGKLVYDQGSQTIYSKYELSAKVESMVLRNDVCTTASYHYSNTDHDNHIRLLTLDSNSRDENQLHYLASYANRRLVLPLTLHHGLRNKLILSSD